MTCCSIIIPVFNQCALTCQCLDALLAHLPAGFDYDTIVVDDASTDQTPQRLAEYGTRIRVLTQTANVGFAAACNRGAAATSGENLVFLNNDTLPTPGWLEAMVGYAERHPRAAVIGSKLLFPNQTIQHAGVVIGQDRYPRHVYTGFPANHPAVNRSRQFQAVTAACALVRREAFRQVGGFDTAFHNGYEDVDLCLRLRHRGAEVHYCHLSVLYHLESMSGGRKQFSQENARLYHSRWSSRVQPDDLTFYLEDGLLRLEYIDGSYPIQLAISPLLATVAGNERKCQADRLLRRRSRQVSVLLHEVNRLLAHVQEAEPRQQVPAPSRFADLLIRRLDPGHGGVDLSDEDSSPEIELQTSGLEENQANLCRRDDVILDALCDLETALASRVQPDPIAAAPVATRFTASQRLRYERDVRALRDLVECVAPRDARVLVISRGDDELLQLDGRTAVHFPQERNGAYAGHNPTDSAEAIQHLEILRAAGADFLLLPKTAFWWLDFYTDFKRHLEERYSLVVRDENTGLLFWLGGPSAPPIQYHDNENDKRPVSS